MTALAIIMLDDYDPDLLVRGFRIAFDELKLAGHFRAGEQIVIKPNILSAVPPEKAATSHPAVFRALAESLIRLGVRPTYGDAPAVDTPERAAKAAGMADVAATLGIPLADFVNKVDCDLPQGKVLKHLPLAQGIAAADGLVSLAKLKTHALTGMTGVIKNLFGVIPGMRKATYHANYPDQVMFCQMLADITGYVRPRLSVMDAIVAMEGNGPRNGRPRRVGAVLVSADPVAVDAAAAFLIGLDASEVLTTRLAHASGLGELDLARMQACLIRPADPDGVVVHGRADLLLEPIKVPDFELARRWQPTKTLVALIGTPLLKQFILNRPVIDDRVCIRCGACAESCPIQPKAVRQTTGDMVPSYNYRLCIRCYCCQEICPAGAIDVRRSLIGKILHT